jgi:hypothetical protein
MFRYILLKINISPAIKAPFKVKYLVVGEIALGKISKYPKTSPSERLYCRIINCVAVARFLNFSANSVT